MKRTLRKQYRLLLPVAALATALAIGCGADTSQDPTRASPTGLSAIRKPDHGRIRTIDRYVPHISTVDANVGEHVGLFVRERVRHDFHLDREDDGEGEGPDEGAHRKAPLGVVLLIPGATQSVTSVYDLPFEDYGWMAHLAEAGFDVFAMDLTGYGFSPRPQMDDPCNVSDDQQSLLIPNRPLAQKCPPSYAFKMAIQSDWDEIDRVVDYLRELRGVDRVSLMGWSRGGPRIGGYSARHPEKVEKLFLYSPAMYIRNGPSGPPKRLPEPGILMQLATVDGFFSNWDRQLDQVNCGTQFDPEIREALRFSLLESDPVGSTWGTEDLWRAPVQNTLWGWNASFARQVKAPTLIMRGDLDVQALEPQQRDLFADLGADPSAPLVQKVFVRVACAGHQLLFENQHRVLLEASEEWLRDGTFAGHDRGSFFVDVKGHTQVE